MMTRKDFFGEVHRDQSLIRTALFALSQRRQVLAAPIPIEERQKREEQHQIDKSARELIKLATRKQKDAELKAKQISKEEVKETQGLVERMMEHTLKHASIQAFKRISRTLFSAVRSMVGNVVKVLFRSIMWALRSAVVGMTALLANPAVLGALIAALGGLALYKRIKGESIFGNDAVTEQTPYIPTEIPAPSDVAFPEFTPSTEQATFLTRHERKQNLSLWERDRIMQKRVAHIANVRALIQKEALKAGVPVELAQNIAKAESSYLNEVKNDRSSATGIFQFIKDTWRLYGKGDVRNIEANVKAGVAFTKSNIKILSKVLGRTPRAYEVYAAHFFGAGVGKLLAANPPMDTGIRQALSVFINESKVERVIADNPGVFRNVYTYQDLLNYFYRKVGSAIASPTVENPGTTQPGSDNIQIPVKIGKKIVSVN